MKRVLTIILAMFILSGCSGIKTTQKPQTPESEKKLEQTNADFNSTNSGLKNTNLDSNSTKLRGKPIIFGRDKIIPFDDKKETVINYYSPDNKHLIVENFLYSSNTKDRLNLGENTITFADKVIWSEDLCVKFDGDSGADSESLANVQWIDNKNVLIKGELIYNIITGKKTLVYNTKKIDMMNYALNNNKTLIAYSYVQDSMDKKMYILSIYDIYKNKFKVVFEKEVDSIHCFDNKIMWDKNKNIIFSTGVKESVASLQKTDSEVLDIWKIDTKTEKSKLLIRNAYLLGETGYQLTDRFVFVKTEPDNIFTINSIGIYDFKEDRILFESNKEKVDTDFWNNSKNIFVYYSKQSNSIKICDDKTGDLISEILVGDFVNDNVSITSIEMKDNNVIIWVYEYKNGTNTSNKYKVDITKLLDKTKE